MGHSEAQMPQIWQARVDTGAAKEESYGLVGAGPDTGQADGAFFTVDFHPGGLYCTDSWSDQFGCGKDGLLDFRKACLRRHSGTAAPSHDIDTFARGPDRQGIDLIGVMNRPHPGGYLG